MLIVIIILTAILVLSLRETFAKEKEIAALKRELYTWRERAGYYDKGNEK